MRSALFWAPDGTFAEPPDLSESGWQMEPIGQPSNLQIGRIRADERVGVAAFDPACVSLSAIQDTVLATRPIEWIALLPGLGARDEGAKRAIGEAFYDYHTMPVRGALLAACLGHASGMAQLRTSVGEHTPENLGELAMIGRSPQMQWLYRSISRIAATDAPVLISGETGTGKELAARSIHDSSARRDASFVAVNCAALPETLIQAELFGYEKGAFTDAKARRIGRIEAAAGGTLFLDEIGDLPLSVQSVLLRFLQEKTIERLGATRPIRLDVRVVTATHVDLEQLISLNRFREDLYYRLNVLRLEVPPLRQRQGDMLLLANNMLERFTAGVNNRVRGFSRAAVERMNSYGWPGNVRELINRVQRAAVMCDQRLISVADLGFERRTSARCVLRLQDSRHQAEQQAVRDALTRFRTVTQASTELGVSRMTLYRLMAKYGMKRSIGASE